MDPCPPTRLRTWELPLAGLLLAGLVAFWFQGAGTGRWAYDDLRILRHALEFAPWQHFIDRPNWQLFSVANLTPLQVLSYQLDLGCCGLSYRAFAVHQLVALWAAALATWRLARAFCAGPWPWCAALLLLVSAPAAAVATNLWNRQYVEGLLLCALALLAAVAAVRRQSGRLGWLGAGLYLLACTAKEVFVPALLVLPFLPAGTWRERARRLWPFALAAALYVPWRLYMLGGALGGYDAIKPTLADQLQLHRLPALLFGYDLLGKAARVAALLLLGAWLGRAPRHLPVVLVALAASLGPLLPIASTVREPDRYVLVAAWLLALGVAAAGAGLAARWPRLGWPALAATALLVAALWGQREHLLQREAQARHDPPVRAAYDFLAQAPVDRTLFLRPPLCDEAFPLLYDWRWVLRRFRPEGTPALLVDECELAEHRGPVWSWDARRGALVEIGAEVPALLAAWRARVTARPLRLELTVDDRDGATLRLGPERDGTYALVSGATFGRFLRYAAGREHTTVADGGLIGRVPLFELRGHARDTLFGRVTFRLRHEAPDGTLSYSPALSFDHGRGVPLVWSR